MKKVFYLVFVTLMFSCGTPKNRTITSEVDDTMGTVSFTISNDYGSVKTSTEKITYQKVVLEGHDYYYRYNHNNHGGVTDLCHSGNCRKCNEK